MRARCRASPGQLLLVTALLVTVTSAVTAASDMKSKTSRPHSGLEHAPRKHDSVSAGTSKELRAHLAAERRSSSAPTLTRNRSGRSVPVEVKPISFEQGLWIFGGSVAFSVVKVLGLSLLYYVAPSFVEFVAPMVG